MQNELSEHEHWTPPKCMNFGAANTTHLTRRTPVWQSRKMKRKKKRKKYVKHTQFAEESIDDDEWMGQCNIAYVERCHTYNARLLLETRKLIRTHTPSSSRMHRRAGSVRATLGAKAWYVDVFMQIFWVPANLVCVGVSVSVWLHLLASPAGNHTAAYHLCILHAHNPTKRPCTAQKQATISFACRQKI